MLGSIFAILVFLTVLRFKKPQVEANQKINVIITAIAPVHKAHQVNHMSNRDIKIAKPNKIIRHFA